MGARAEGARFSLRKTRSIMRTSTQFAILCSASSLALLIGCSGAGSLLHAPADGFVRADARFASLQHFEGFFSCPATGRLVYVSDYNHNLINVYAGRLEGQAPCGRLTAKVIGPWGLFVK